MNPARLAKFVDCMRHLRALRPETFPDETAAKAWAATLAKSDMTPAECMEAVEDCANSINGFIRLPFLHAAVRTHRQRRHIQAATLLSRQLPAGRRKDGGAAARAIAALVSEIGEAKKRGQKVSEETLTERLREVREAAGKEEGSI